MNIKQIKGFIKSASASHGELTTLREVGSVDQREYDEKSQLISLELTKKLQEVEIDALIDDDFHENIPGLNQEVTYYKLLTEVDFINNFGNLVKNGDGVEDAISLIFNADETTIKITHLFQKYMTEDLKSDLTEEFAWIYDYIRNIASEEEKLDHLKEINNSKLTGKDATTHLRGLLIPIKKSINANQLNNELHVPFYFQNVEDRKDIVERTNDDVDLDDVNSAMDLFEKEEDKGRGFKKATGGLPDVVSINPETGKVNFTAANSLSSLTMESDQLERHSSMIALAISLCKEYPKDFSKNLNKVTYEIKDITHQRSLYFSMWYGTPEFKYGNKALDLARLRGIWEDKIDITFFQTYTSKNIVPAVANDFVNRNHFDIKSTRDAYRKVNERTRALLANSQTIANETFTNTNNDKQKYPSEAISFQAQNNKSNPKSIKPVNKNISDFKNDILKIKNIGDHLQGVDFAMESGLDNMDEEGLNENKEYTLTDLSLINMLGSADLLRTSALVNIATVYGDEYKRSKNPDLLTKLEGLRSYSVRSLSSFGQDTSRQIADIRDSVKRDEDNRPQAGQELYETALSHDDPQRVAWGLEDAIKNGFPIQTILENKKIPEKIRKDLIKQFTT